MENNQYFNVIHKEQLDALKEFHSFCVNNNIKYSLHGGTLLGAIREKGFIPWDDDVDISFFRDEYEKFRKAYSINGINDKFRINDYGFDIWYKNGNNRAICLDVMIYDYISENKVIQKIKYILLLILKAMNRTNDDMKMVKERGKYKGIKYLIYYFVFLVGKLIPKEMKYNIEENIRKSFIGSKSLVHRSKAQPSEIKMILPSTVIQEYIIVKFESIELMIFKKCKHILLQMYGDDYMIPKRDDNEFARYNKNQFIDKMY